LRGTVRAEVWVWAEKAETQRNQGLIRDTGEYSDRLLGRVDKSWIKSKD